MLLVNAMMNAIQPEHLLSTVGVLLGFQVAAFTWRVNRELQFRDRVEIGTKIDNGTAPSDWLSVASMVLNVFSIILVLLQAPFEWALGLFASSLVLFATYPFALLGHYDLFSRTTHEVGSQQPATVKEWWAILIGSCSALFVGLHIGCSC